MNFLENPMNFLENPKKFLENPKNFLQRSAQRGHKSYSFLLVSYKILGNPKKSEEILGNAKESEEILGNPIRNSTNSGFKRPPGLLLANT